ncbi:hypothetical protein ACFWOT_37055 [Streptomyces sp. NPDC058440]|uniref:hypothetical protein n=1 Tax=Streptomyces sp. NPDC058440 TaxID=3346501 RepID=UPI0036696950
MHAQEPMPGPPAVQIPCLVRSVGPGWHAVLYRLHGQLVALCPGYRALGVKEKFGGLRVQVDLGERAAREAAAPFLRAAEADAAVLCEFCARPGRARRRNDVPTGWIKTVCDDCHRAWSAREIMLVNGAVRSHERGPGKPAAPRKS